jgi:hypothetical protein
MRRGGASVANRVQWVGLGPFCDWMRPSRRPTGSIAPVGACPRFTLGPGAEGACGQPDESPEKLEHAVHNDSDQPEGEQHEP